MSQCDSFWLNAHSFLFTSLFSSRLNPGSWVYLFVTILQTAQVSEMEENAKSDSSEWCNSPLKSSCSRDRDRDRDRDRETATTASDSFKLPSVTTQALSELDNNCCSLQWRQRWRGAPQQVNLLLYDCVNNPTPFPSAAHASLSIFQSVEAEVELVCSCHGSLATQTLSRKRSSLVVVQATLFKLQPLGSSFTAEVQWPELYCFLRPRQFGVARLFRSLCNVQGVNPQEVAALQSYYWEREREREAVSGLALVSGVALAATMATMSLYKAVERG